MKTITATYSNAVAAGINKLVAAELDTNSPWAIAYKAAVANGDDAARMTLTAEWVENFKRAMMAA